jgi:uncharacterized protein YbcV (DUF1398 family)
MAKPAGQSSDGGTKRRKPIMDESTRHVVIATSRASEEHRITFPEVVAQLAAAGIERNSVDLVTGTSTYYTSGGETEVVRFPRPDRPAADFSAEGVAAAVARSQRENTPFPAFRAEIAGAGCVGFCVSLPGRRVVYYGRNADSHIEHFPPAA